MSKNLIRTDAANINLILFCCLALMWSGSFINIKLVVMAMPPIFCAMMRVLVSLVCLAIFFTAANKRFLRYTTGCWRIWVAGAFTQAIPFGLLFYGEKFVAPALASIVNSTVSIWALILGACLFKDMASWTPLRVGGLILGFAGIVIIFAPSLNHGQSSAIGVIAITGMAISYAFGSLLSQHIIFGKMQVTFETNLFHQHVASVLMLMLASLLFETWPTINQVTEPRMLFAFLYLGLIATAIAWIIYFYLIREWGAVRATSVTYVVPVLAIIWDLLFLHLVPTVSELMGAAAILISVVLIQWTRKMVIKE